MLALTNAYTFRLTRTCTLEEICAEISSNFFHLLYGTASSDDDGRCRNCDGDKPRSVVVYIYIQSDKNLFWARRNCAGDIPRHVLL